MNHRFTMLLVLGLCAALALSGCDTYKVTPPVNEPAFENDPIIDRSLFNAPDRTISEEDIQRLLNGKIVIPDSVRIAVFNFSDYSGSSYRYGYWNDEELLKTQQSYLDTLRTTIFGSAKVHKIILMPSLLANKESSITNLREVAVRLQVDFLLIYAVKSDIYYKYKLFNADEAKAFATCEAFLMDIRTSLIPFSTIITEEHLIKKSGKDLTIEEMRKRAEIEAVVKALSKTGAEVVNFLN